MNERKLSRRQRHILDFIRGFVRERLYAPSIRQIGEGVDLSSSSTVHSHLKALEAKGFIKRDPSKPRSLRLVDSRDLPKEAAERLTDAEANAARYRHAMETALANPHAWRETLEEALNPMPVEAMENGKVAA